MLITYNSYKNDLKHVFYSFLISIIEPNKDCDNNLKHDTIYKT